MLPLTALLLLLLPPAPLVLLLLRTVTRLGIGAKVTVNAVVFAAAFADLRALAPLLLLEWSRFRFAGVPASCLSGSPARTHRVAARARQQPQQQLQHRDPPATGLQRMGCFSRAEIEQFRLPRRRITCGCAREHLPHTRHDQGTALEREQQRNDASDRYMACQPVSQPGLRAIFLEVDAPQARFFFFGGNLDKIGRFHLCFVHKHKM